MNSLPEGSSGQEETVEVVRPRNTIQYKVKKGGGPSLDEIMADAEAALDDLKDNYEVWVREDLEGIAAQLKALDAAGDEEASLAVVKAIHGVAHNIKGQAATFDYQLLTEVAHSLCGMISHDELAATRLKPLIELHVEAMRLIVGQQIKGKGGATGKELVAGLHAAVQKKLSAAG